MSGTLDILGDVTATLTSALRTDLARLLAEHDPEADEYVQELRVNQIASVCFTSKAAINDPAWLSWCRTRHIPHIVREAHEKRIYDYSAEFSGFDLTTEQVASRALGSLDAFFMSLPDENDSLTERTIEPLVALNWIHTFKYPSAISLDHGVKELVHWHHLSPQAWPLAAAGFTPAEYVTAATRGTAPTLADAKVLAALRGYHFLPGPNEV